MGRQRADIVTMSHQHPHHSHHGGIEGDPKLLDGPGEYEIASLYISGMATDRNDRKEDRQINTVFTIHSEGLALCHLGDLNHVLSTRQIEELGQVDILFVPAGGVCTISASHVTELINLMEPKIVVPIHYRTEETGIELQPLETLARDMGVTEPDHESRLNITDSNLPRETRLVVLERVT
jgi:L-ascorbate metabolism protein UlaG (beta-lactamase superfamily)